MVKILTTAGSPRGLEGGTSAIVINLGRELEALGHEVTYLFRQDLVQDDEMRGRFRELKFAWRLAKYIRRHPGRFDIVNLHAPVGFLYGLLRKIFPDKNGPRYVVCLHALEERRVYEMKREHRKGRAWHFNWKNRAWQRVYNQSRFDYSVKTADAAHCYCRDVRTILHLKYDLDPDKVLFVLNGVADRFFVQRDYSEARPLRLLYAGTWLDQRGIFYLRDALSHMLPTFSDWTITFAGVATSAETILDFFAGPLQKHVDVRPIVAAGEMPQLYSQHDVFVFPSLLEGLPSVILEAMAAGMPVVTTDTCGMPDIIEDGVDGLLVPTADADAIEDALLRLAHSSELRASLGRAAQSKMRRYTWQSAARKLEALFLSVTNKAETKFE